MAVLAVDRQITDSTLVGVDRAIVMNVNSLVNLKITRVAADIMKDTLVDVNRQYKWEVRG